MESCMPPNLQVFGVADIEQAFRHMQSGNNVGKLVVEMRKDDRFGCVLSGPQVMMSN